MAGRFPKYIVTRGYYLSRNREVVAICETKAQAIRTAQQLIKRLPPGSITKYMVERRWS
jgi:hypothetical protein